MSPSVSVTIVSHNSRRYRERCLRSVFEQTHRPLEVVVVDNASTDGSPDILARFEGRIRLIRNDRNAGFAAAQNQAIRATGGDWVLALNPDTALLPDFISELIEGGQIDEKVGTVCGR